MLRLTPKNQAARLAEDAERVRAGRSPDFSVGQHIQLLIDRVETLEAALRDSDRSREASETGTGSTEGKSAGRNAASPEGTRHD